MTYPNGTVAEYTYDSLNRLTYLENRKSTSEIISSYTYTLGPAGNRLQVVENTGRVVDYTYDATYRLTEEAITDAVNGNETITYTYDLFGNRLTKTDSSGTVTYSYDINDRLLTEVGPGFSYSYAYDNNGNTILKTDGVDSTDYVYNYENQLVSVQTATSQVDYAYDADGIRVQSIVDSAVTNFLVDKNRPYAQVLEETDDTSSLTVRYVYGDDLISQHRAGISSYYHYDGQMSTRQLTDDTEIVTDTYVYDAFGILLDQTGATENNYRYTGEQFDHNIGFYYLRARYYDQHIGRFVTTDPFKGVTIEPKSLHKYMYANMNPVMFVDPSGESSINELMVNIGILSILYSIQTTHPIVKVDQHCCEITMKRKHIDIFGEDKYGHWWVEIGNESYGWWPKYPVDLRDTLIGIEGELNGQTSFGGSPTQDPHHGDDAEDTFNPYITSNAPISYTCTRAKTCIKNFANSYSGSWSWPIGQNCHSFQESMMSKCYLEKR